MAFLLGTLAQAWSNSQSAQQVQAAQQQLRSVQNQNKSLTKAASHYQDPAVVENEARQQLGYTRPGEHLVVVIGSNKAQRGFWQDWWNAFFGG
jgi:cell division protein FtsB